MDEDGPSTLAVVEPGSWRQKWTRPLPSQFAAVTTTGDLILARRDGTLTALAADTGELLAEAPLVVRDLPARPTTLAARGNRIIVGTVDGHVLHLPPGSGQPPDTDASGDA